MQGREADSCLSKSQDCHYADEDEGGDDAPDVEPMDDVVPAAGEQDAIPEGSPGHQPANDTPRPKPEALVSSKRLPKALHARGTHLVARLCFPLGSEGNYAVQRRLQEGDTATPGSALKQEARTPWKTPAPVFREAETPATAVAASGWQQLCAASGQTLTIHL